MVRLRPSPAPPRSGSRLQAIHPRKSLSVWRTTRSSFPMATFMRRRWSSVWASRTTDWCEPAARVTRPRRKSRRLIDGVRRIARQWKIEYESNLARHHDRGERRHGRRRGQPLLSGRLDSSRIFSGRATSTRIARGRAKRATTTSQSMARSTRCRLVLS